MLNCLITITTIENSIIYKKYNKYPTCSLFYMWDIYHFSSLSVNLFSYKKGID